MKFNLLRYTNLVLLTTVLALAITGTFGLIWSQAGWIFELHRIMGWVLIILIPWKTGIAARSLRRGFRKTFNRSWMILISLFLACLALLVVVLGTLWLSRISPEESWLRQTVISWHWMLGLGLLVPLGIHVWRRWPKPKRVDFLSRRGILRSLGFGAAALVIWEGFNLVQGKLSQDKRVSGSHEKNSYQENFYPITNGPNEGIKPVDIATWQLNVTDLQDQTRSYRYAELLALPTIEKTVVIDCTLGWYSTQLWKGVPLASLLDLEGKQRGRTGVRLEAVSGYSYTIPMPEARSILLATHVGNQQLDPAHGFPLRAVIPTRRGWFWVKWLTRVQLVLLDAQPQKPGL